MGCSPQNSRHLQGRVKVSCNICQMTLLVVSGHSVLSATLHVQSCKVQSEVLAWLLEEMVGDLLSDGVVEGLSHLVDQSHHVGVSPASLVQVVRLLQHF